MQTLRLPGNRMAIQLSRPCNPEAVSSCERFLQSINCVLLFRRSLLGKAANAIDFRP